VVLLDYGEGAHKLELITDIPPALDGDRIRTQARVEEGSQDAAALSALLDLARRAGRPKVAYRACFLGQRRAEAVQVGEVWFRSRTLVRNLASVERVFAFVATCGHELDEVFPGKGDMVQEYWWDLIKSELLGAAIRHGRERLCRLFRLGTTATMSPGSGDASIWPIEQQKELFTLLGDVEGALGVRLTESFLMIPNKTISGLLFPAEVDFETCEVCHREDCPSRRAPFNRALCDEIQHA